MPLSSNELMEIFDQGMAEGATYKHLDDSKNPCHIMFEGVEYYIYVKNLSSAYFSNPDVSRAQMTGIDTLNKIKDTDALFILLGYDSENEVYAAWNPHIAKQRIGTAASPSLYSRFSWQKEAKELGDFITRELKNDGSVLLFPREYISVFLGNIEMFFPDTSEYVAMGSKRRSGANAAYRELTDLSHLKEFAKHLASSSYDQEQITKYVSAVKQLITTSLISNNRKIFLACDTLEEYNEAADTFLALDEVKELDANKDNIFSYAFPAYISFLIDEYGESEYEGIYSEIEDNIPETLVEKESEEDKVTPMVDIDYETPYLDENGYLTRIANPELIGMLREDLDTEYPRMMAAYATIEDFYGDRFPNMEMYHWQALLNKTNWSNPYSQTALSSKTAVRKRSERQKIRVQFPDGRVICENQVVKTLLAVIDFAGVDNVRNLKITMGKNGGSLLIENTVNQKYANAFKPLGNGWYVNTCSDTPTKLNQINQINDSLGLGLTINLV